MERWNYDNVVDDMNAAEEETCNNCQLEQCLLKSTSNWCPAIDLGMRMYEYAKMRERGEFDAIL